MSPFTPGRKGTASNAFRRTSERVSPAGVERKHEQPRWNYARSGTFQFAYHTLSPGTSWCSFQESCMERNSGT